MAERLPFTLTDRARLLMSKAKEIADQDGVRYVGVQHIAAAMLEIECGPGDLFKEKDICKEDFLLP